MSTNKNIPIYRAKKIDSDEWVEGFFRRIKSSRKNAIHGYCNYIDQSDTDISDEYEIDPNTLAIHFPNMIDKNGKKIFASLSEDGVGGDILKTNTDFRTTCKWDTNTSSIFMEEYGSHLKEWEFTAFEVIGIHKGE